MTKKRYNYIDLFAGCGGLSLGLERSGFELELAVEKSDMAAETFYHNFIERITDKAKWKEFCSKKTSVQDQARQKLIVKELKALLDCDELVEELKRKDIDLIAGGPPCQGFSLAGRRNPDDARNLLPWQFIELIERTRPKAVIIENVSGMRQNFVKHNKEAPFEQLRIALIQSGYTVQPVLLNAMHFGVPQHRPRVMLIGLRNDIASILDITAYDETWKSEYDQLENIPFDKRPDLAPIATHFGEDILTVKDAISDLDNDGYQRDYVKSRYLDHIKSDVSWMPEHMRDHSNELKNHNLRNHADNIVERFRLYQYLQSQNISPKILSLPKDDSLSANHLKILIKEQLANAILPAISPDKHTIATTLEDLVEVIISLGTKKHSQRPLKLNAPSPTIVSLPDDFVHPTSPRTLTVREMARFQSFPDSFEFRAKETTGSMRRRFEVPQYTQVGNAVPPLMAEAAGQVISSILGSYYSILEDEKQMKKAG